MTHRCRKCKCPCTLNWQWATVLGNPFAACKIDVSACCDSSVDPLPADWLPEDEWEEDEVEYADDIGE